MMQSSLKMIHEYDSLKNIHQTIFSKQTPPYSPLLLLYACQIIESKNIWEISSCNVDPKQKQHTKRNLFLCSSPNTYHTSLAFSKSCHAITYYRDHLHLHVFYAILNNSNLMEDNVGSNIKRAWKPNSYFIENKQKFGKYSCNFSISKIWFTLIVHVDRIVVF